RIAAWDWAGQGMTMAVAGQVRLADLQAGIIATGDLDARMLTPFIRPAGLSASGRLAPRLSITGPLAAPRVDGDLTLTGAEVRLVDPRIVVSGLNGRAVLTRTTANLTNVTGTINGGSLALSGQAEFVPREAVQATLTAAIRGMGIEVPDGLRSEVDADLTLAITQTLDADINTLSGSLGGTITVLRGSYREPLAVLGALMSGAQAPSANVAPVAGSPLLENLALDLRLVTSDDVIVNNNTARLAAGADLRINGTAAAPAVGGRIDLREGGRIFLGRNVYEIVAGSVDFTDPAAIRPELDVQLTTRAGGQPVDVALSGSADAPDVSLSSTNPELTQADLTALLVTGRRFDELASADAALIGSTVIGNLSGDVLGFAGRAVGLDTLRLGGVDADTARRDPTAAASEVDPTSRLTFGKSIGSNVDVTFSQSLREGDAQTWIVDYLPSRRLLLRLVSNDEDLRAYSFRHDVAVGAPQLARPPAVARAAEPRVARVTLDGTLAVPDEELRDLLRLEAGDRFDFASWQDDRERLERFYRASNRLAARITASRSDVADGVALAYTIEAGPETRIDVSGTTLAGATLDQLRDAWAVAIVDDLLVDEARQIVSDALSADGYLRPQITAGLTGEGGVRTLEIVAAAGVRTTDVRMQPSGVDAALETDLIAWADAERRMQAVRSPGAFETAVLTYIQDRGYLGAQVRVGAPRLEGSSAEVPVSIATGRQLVVSAIRFEGTSLPDGQLRAAVALDPGAPLGPGRLEDARQRLVTLYRREGFPSVEVAARPSAEDIVFAVDEGPRQSIADVAVSGSGRVDADVVSRALMLAPGAPLRADDLLAARSRLFDTGLFRRVDVVTEPIEGSAAAPATVPMRVRVTLEEWPALRLRYGIEVVEERAEDALTGRNLVPGLSADLTRRTLFGRPVGFGVALDYRNRDRSARTFLSAPTFLGRSIETALTLEWTRSVNPSETVDNRRSLSLEQRIRRSSVQLSYGYRFERSRTDLPPDPLIGPLPPFIITVGRLTSSLAVDTRNDPVQPIRGTFVAVSLEYAPQVGSDFEFARYSAQAYRFTPWRDIVFASAARFGAVHAFGGQEVIPSERFFAGGARSVRGVAEEGLGERDFFGDPVGGEALLLLNQEVRFPIYRWLRGVGFVDAGNVFAAPSAIRLGDLTVSAGAGLRLVTPFAILRADVGRVLETGGHRWTFGIGHAF
ncbi:MAG: translocation/assembly module TamB domain-containing protein, partial [Vicinamibacterales bacterium]